jgi:2',3'-cyclic-nucleotide 2'-phosphodiesterase (5'-nucleotidase family)
MIGKRSFAETNVYILLGDLHDGAGLSDATSPNGNVSNIIFENVDYDLLTIGRQHCLGI